MTLVVQLLLWISPSLAAGASDGSDGHDRRLRARTSARASAQSSDDDVFSSDDDESYVDQLAEDEARALELAFGSEGIFGSIEDHHRAQEGQIAQDNEARALVLAFGSGRHAWLE